MSEHSLEQALSALMDGEASELELQRILKHLDDPAVRQRWQHLNHVRSAMHREPLMQVDVSQAVRAALAEDSRADTAPAASSTAVASTRKGWQSVAIAASVMLAVLGGVRLYNQDSLPQATALAQAPVQVQAQPATAVATAAAMPYMGERPVVLASYGGLDAREEQAESQRAGRWQREELPLYLKQHARQSGAAGSVLPYARTASMEGR